MASPFWSTNPTPGNLESTCTMIPLEVLNSIYNSTRCLVANIDVLIFLMDLMALFIHKLKLLSG